MALAVFGIYPKDKNCGIDLDYTSDMGGGESIEVVPPPQLSKTAIKNLEEREAEWKKYFGGDQFTENETKVLSAGK